MHLFYGGEGHCTSATVWQFCGGAKGGANSHLGGGHKACLHLQHVAAWHAAWDACMLALPVAAAAAALLILSMHVLSCSGCDGAVPRSEGSLLPPVVAVVPDVCLGCFVCHVVSQHESHGGVWCV